jgi:hypothetical protein
MDTAANTEDKREKIQALSLADQSETTGRQQYFDVLCSTTTKDIILECKNGFIE